MKKIVTSMVLSLAILSVSLYSTKSEAIIGLIFKNKVVKTIGGLGALGGGIGAGGSIFVLSTTTGLATGVLAAFALIGSTIFTGIGLIILDDNEIADIEFRKLNLNNSSEFNGFSIDDASIYNSEVEVLNTIRQTIVSEVSETEDTIDAENLWLEYSEYLSPVTFEIAKLKANEFLRALNK